MAVNRYDRPADAPIINTYVPIDFDQLYRIGITQKSAIDDAAEQLSTAVQRFGEFRSPSRVDTERYYAETLGKMAPWIEQAAADPDAMKDAGWRAGLQAALNGLNYVNISQLQESADNLRAGLEMRAKMEAEGLYNRNWDRSDIANYNTLSSGVFSDITPIRYMSANELSNPYFDNLKPSDLGLVTRNGVRYNRTGINYDTLYSIAEARFNDLVRTPQGQMYYRDLLQANGNDPESARAAFVSMIADSQRDRIVDSYEVDPAWIAQLRASSTGSGKSNPFATPTRLNFIREGILRTTQGNLQNNATREQVNVHNRQQAYLEEQFALAYRQYLSNPTDDNLAKAKEAQTRVYTNQGSFLLENNRRQMDKEFTSVFGQSMYDELPEEFHNQNYLKAVGKALSSVENDIALTPNDRLITNLGATPINITESNGSIKQSFQFNTSVGFLLPEQVMKLIGDPDGKSIPQREVTRSSWWSLEPTGFDTALNSGQFNTVQFIPDNKIIQVSPDVYAVKGKARLPQEDVERILGTGTIGLGASDYRDETSILEFGTHRLRPNLKGNYNMKEVKEKVGDDDVTYYEFDTYRLLPSVTRNPEWWTATETGWNNTNTYGGIGSAAMASDAYQSSAMQNLGF